MTLSEELLYVRLKEDAERPDASLLRQPDADGE